MTKEIEMETIGANDLTKWEIFFQSKEPMKLKGRLVGVYIVDEKKWLESTTQAERDKMTKVKADSLYVRNDLKHYNFVMYIEDDGKDAFIHIVIKED